METTRIQSNNTETVYFLLLDANNDGVTGLSGAQLNMLTLMRKDDGLYYTGAGWGAKTSLAVSAQGATDSPGLYYYTTPSLAEGEYVVTVDTSYAENVPQIGQIKVGSYIDNIDYASSLLVRSATPTNELEVDADGKVQVANLTVGSGNINTISESFTLTTGTVISGTYTSTQSVNATYHQIADSAGTLDAYYQFDISSNGVPTAVNVTGRVNGSNDDLTVYAYVWGTSSWQVLALYAGQAGTTDTNREFILLTTHVGTGINLGKVRIRFYGTGLTTANLYVDQIYVKYTYILQRSGYENGAVWIDTIDGTSGTTIDYNGIVTRPALTYSNLMTLLTSLGLHRVEVIDGSSLTFASTMDNLIINGRHYDVYLNGQSCDHLVLYGANVNGLHTGTSLELMSCYINDITTPSAEFHECILVGDIVFNSATVHHFLRCTTKCTATVLPSLDFGISNGDCVANIRGFNGCIEFKNLNVGDDTDIIYIDGAGKVVISASCVGGVIYIRGNFDIIDNSDGLVTVIQTANYGIQNIRDAMKLAPTAGDPVAGSIDKHLDDVQAKTDNLPSGVKKNTALASFTFFMRDNTNHATGKTGLTVTAERSIDGAAFAACSNTVAEIGSGVYKINLSATDMNGDVITLKFTGTGADATVVTIVTEP